MMTDDEESKAASLGGSVQVPILHRCHANASGGITCWVVMPGPSLAWTNISEIEDGAVIRFIPIANEDG